MSIEPTTEEPLGGLLPGHVVLHGGRRLVVDEVTRKLGGWSVAARPEHRSEGRRVVVEFDDEKATVTRVAAAAEAEGVRGRLAAAIRTAMVDEKAAYDVTAKDKPPYRPMVAVSEERGEAGEPLPIVVVVGGHTWAVEL